MKKPLIILTGPTAVGKTAASIGLAKAIGGEIISADSMQVYRHMDIGSAKIRSKEMQGISHHLIDVLEPEEEFHVVKFQQMAKEALDVNDDRVNLYERINKRVDAMFEEGLVEEVTALQERGYTRGMVSMQGLGYKEIFAYLDGECTLEEAKEIIKRDTRHFAKRQITWFKRERDVIWINKQEYGYQEEKILERILKELKVREIFPQKEEEIK